MLGGIMCPMISPMGLDGHIDTLATAALLRYLLDGGIDAILIAGTTGEFPCLSDVAWNELVAEALAGIGGAVPAAVNVSHCSLRIAADRARHAASLGATHVASTPPYYVPLTGEALVRFYYLLADASPVPVVLYNIPQYTQSDLTAALPRIAAHPNIVGIKDSSGLYEGMAAIPQRTGRSFIRLAGTDVLLPAAIAQGLDGVVPGLANVVPGLYHSWWKALQAGDTGTAQRAEAAIRRLTGLYEVIPGTAPHMHLYRYALRLRGIDAGDPSGMGFELDEEVKSRIGAALDAADELLRQL